MKIHALQILITLAVACGLVDAEQTRAAAAPAKSAFTFRGVGYLHRWSMNGQYEFTPEGQQDLEKWSDMITMNVYPDAHDGEASASKANAVLENYKSHQGMVLKTNSVPRTSDRPAEHFIAVVLGGRILSRWHLRASNWWMPADVRSSIHIAFTARKLAIR